MNVSAGSIESSDIKIVIEEGHAAMQCMNMVPELTDRQVYEYVVPILKQYGLADLSPRSGSMEPMIGWSAAAVKPCEVC